MARKRVYKKSKWIDDSVIATGEVLSIDFINKEVGNNLKTVFYVSSTQHIDGRQCVIWGRQNFKVGDKVEMKGRFSNDIFLAWSLQYSKQE